MHKHLQCHHPRQFREVEQAKPTGPTPSKTIKIDECFANAEQWKTDSTKYNEVTAEVTRMICKDAMALQTVEKPGFKRFIKYVFNGKYQAPSKKQFTNVWVEKLYNETQASVQNQISSLQWYSATTDMWSSIGMTPYISLTIHYIDDMWNLQSKMLQTMYMPQDHTGNNIRDVIEDSLVSWGLKKECLVALTTDNGSNVKLAARLLQVSRVPCYGHVLHNGVHFALDSLEEPYREAITSVRKLNTTFAHSHKRKRELSVKQQDLGLPNKAFPGECKTRWGSMFKMIDYVLQQEAAIRGVLNERSTVHLIPTDDQLKVT